MRYLHDYHFFFVVRILKIYSLSYIKIYNILLLIVVTLMYSISTGCVV